MNFNPNDISTPCFVVDESLLAKNLDILSSVKKNSGCKILLALKCFSMFKVFPLFRQVLDGVCASSPHEARLGREEFQKEVHTFAAAYSTNDILDLCETTDHLVFNSFGQFERFNGLVKKRSKELKREIEFGIRINPEHSEGSVPIYDPCSPGSRLGVKHENFIKAVDSNIDILDEISGIHWHNLCEQDSDCLERTVNAVEAKFSRFIPKMKYVNFGGGHHITRDGYNIKLLERIINNFQQKWGVQVYLEPGEAVALNAGYFVVTILDIIKNSNDAASIESFSNNDKLVKDNIDIAIMDGSVPAHTPDVIEMPYRPYIIDSENPESAGTIQDSHEMKKNIYRVGGLSCLAGDVAGIYAFNRELEIGDKLVFTDMAIYTMVKTNTFNGIGLPSIALVRKDDKKVEVVKQFGYSDFKNRLS